MLAVSVSSDTCTGRVADNSSVLTAENLLTVDEIYRLIQRATLVVGGPRAYLQWRAVSKRAKWLNEHVAVLCDSVRDRDDARAMSLFDYMQSYPLAGANGARWAVRTGCRDAVVCQLHAVVGGARPQFMELAYEAVLQRKECVLRIVYDVLRTWDVVVRGIVTAVVNLAVATGWLLPIILLAEYGLAADTNILHSLDNHKILPSALGLLSGDADEILCVLEPAMVANTLLRADVFVGACNALMDTLMAAFETALAIAREWSITVETFIAADARDSIIEYALYVENQRILDSIAPEICYVASAHVDDITAACTQGDAIPMLLVVIVRAQLTRSFAWLTRTRGWRMSENVLYYVIAHGTAEMAQIALAGAAIPCARLLEAAILSERADVLSVVCAHGCEITFSTGACCIAYISADWWTVVTTALDRIQISCYHVAHALLGAPGKYFTPPAKHVMEAVLIAAARCAKYHSENVIVHMAECGLLEDLARVDMVLPVRTPRVYNRIMDSDSIAAAVKNWFEPYGDTTEYAEYTARMAAKSARVQTERAKTNALLRRARELARDYESRHTCYLRVVANTSDHSQIDSYRRYEWDTYAGWRTTAQAWIRNHKPPAHIAIVDALPRDRAELDEFADQLALAAAARAQNQITAKRKRNRRTNARRLTASERRERERNRERTDDINIIDCSEDIASKYVATQSKTVAQPRAIIFVNVTSEEVRAFAKRRRLV